jgi:hypothetical protein
MGIVLKTVQTARLLVLPRRWRQLWLSLCPIVAGTHAGGWMGVPFMGSVINTKWPLTRAAPRGLTNLCTHHQWDSIAGLIRRFFIPVMVSFVHTLALRMSFALGPARPSTVLTRRRGDALG